MASAYAHGRTSPYDNHQSRYDAAATSRRYSADGQQDHPSDEEVAEHLRGHHPYAAHHHAQQDGYDDRLVEEDEEGDLRHREHEEDEEEEDEEEGSASFSDSLSSSPSIPDEDIDFSLVYALHTFLATVDGQASVVKGDKLLLLDDTNSYWWLVRVLKTQHVGYIPAENIETPYERLARLNKHRNVDLTTVTHEDVVSGPSSAMAQTRFAKRIPPSQQPHPHESRHPHSKGIPASPSHKDHPVNMSPMRERRQPGTSAKTVNFTAPTYYNHSGNEMSEEGEDEEGEIDEMAQDETVEPEDQQQGQQIFDDEESDFSQNDEDDGPDEPVIVQNRAHAAAAATAAQQAHAAQQHAQHGQYDDGHEADVEDEPRQSQGPARSTSAPSQSATPIAPVQTSPEREKPYDWRGEEEADDVEFNQSRESDEVFEQRSSGNSSIKNRQFDDISLDQHTPTKKLTATPPIVRDTTFDINDPYGDLPGGRPSYSSPVKVNGVELLNPSDPKYTKLMPDRRQREEYGVAPIQYEPSARLLESATSAGSSDLQRNSSLSQRGSEDSNRGPVGYTAPSPSKKLKKGRESLDGGEEKKKKSGGILGGLFRKKDKKKGKNEEEAQQLRSSDETGRLSPSTRRSGSSLADSASSTSQPAPLASSKRMSQTTESLFGMDAALRQQEVEAKQALRNQYGVQRNPGDLTNTMTPRNVMTQGQLSPSTASAPLSPLASPAINRIRPGSLMGSPSIPGVEVPLLNVLRVFAGDDIKAESTFKTVLLSHATSASDLVKQAMQRFRLGDGQDLADYFLTIKELGGEERVLESDEKPLVVFESLSDTPDGSRLTVPAVKRSSVGSIDSIASNLSLNPAISRLGMNDFSDDSIVKVYLHRRVRRASQDKGSTLQANQRFAVKLVLNAADLPESIVFDPQSNAVIPKVALQERLQRSQAQHDDSDFDESAQRERIVFLPQNVTVLEAVEAALDRFGIVEGMIDGGDEVEEKLTRRKSNSRVKYGLCVSRSGSESPLPPNSKLIDAYDTPPILKAYDRTSKEFKRRSLDATLILGSSNDLRPTDPVFVLRKASHRMSSSSGKFGSGPVPADEVALRRASLDKRGDGQRRPEVARSVTTASTATGVSEYVTPTEELSEKDAAPAPLTRQEIIAAQRAATRATQLSAQRNAAQGVDITMPGKGMIRSSRLSVADPVRYSYIDVDGQETDISDIVQDEWTTESIDEHVSGRTSQATVPASDAESFKTARASPTSLTSTSASNLPLQDEDEDDDEQAVSALRSAPIMIDTAMSGPSQHHNDVLQSAVAPRSPTAASEGTLQDRLDRVLARVREDRRNGSSDAVTRSAEATPTVPVRTSSAAGQHAERNVSPTPGSTGRRSPLVAATGGRASPSIGQIMQQQRLGSPNGPATQHSKKLSGDSSTSSHQTGRTESPLTANGASPSNPLSGFTPATSSESQPLVERQPLVYRDDFGLDLLMAVVDADSYIPPRQRQIDPVRDMLFGPSLDDLDLHPEVREWYSSPKKSIDDIEKRLDALIARMN